MYKSSLYAGVEASIVSWRLPVLFETESPLERVHELTHVLCGRLDLCARGQRVHRQGLWAAALRRHTDAMSWLCVAFSSLRSHAACT